MGADRRAPRLDPAPPHWPDRQALVAWGRHLGASLAAAVAASAGASAVVTLSGEVGAGKTTLVRAICEGAGVPDLDAVTSPTFAILQEYPAPVGPVVHADLYRVRSPHELAALGWDEVMATAPLLLVEWPEVAAGTFPSGTLHLRLAHVPDDPDRRSVTVPAGVGEAA
ncbi:MAG: tRNA (adenosine(37)-N6)-threonylcarbamoyltransferase complex ATPase subunit type 1 TsaE [Gemmatimonadetes bacterium]|nr:tRNA (adenosine(37)-N6)-threonylcarbamoyltransferase complex ATPase subunit type 1 TsaE [Gemmatimonadota bacterium]